MEHLHVDLKQHASDHTYASTKSAKLGKKILTFLTYEMERFIGLHL